MQMQTKATLSLFMTAFIWGVAFICVDKALAAGWQAFPLLMCRGFIGGIAMLFFSYKKKWWKNKTTLTLGFISGTLFFLGFTFQTFGQSLSSVPNTAFITTLNILFVPLIAFVFMKRKIAKKVYIACVLALVGTGVLSFSDSISLHFGDIYLLICALFFALQIIYNEKCGQHNDVLSITCIQLLTMGVWSSICMPISGQTFIPSISWENILFLALFSSAIASVFQLYGQGHVDTSKASLILSLESIIATIASIVLLGQPLTTSILIGGSLMFSAVIIVEYKRKNKDLQS